MPRQSRRFAAAALLFLPLLHACGPDSGAEAGTGEAVAAVEGVPAPPTVRSGARVLLDDSASLVRGRRVGLITNHTGLVESPDGTARATADVLAEMPDADLVALFGPEHGIRGDAEAGVSVDDAVDAATGVPVYSLYGGTREPSADVLAELDVLLFDIQDIGTRYYTYVWTMSLAMEAAGAAGVPFVVLDRPNPIGGTIQGNVLDPEYSTFVGRFAVPMRHGLTPGELARLLVGAFGVEVDLTVVPVDGWTREQPFGETGLPWVPPSPNMPDVTSALHYPGTCLFEGTPLSVARGTPIAFQQVGAPWLDAEALASALAAHALPDTEFEAVTFVPENPGDGKFGGEEVHGVRFVAAGPDYDPTRAAVAVLIETRRQAPDRWDWRVAHFDRLAGTDALRLGIEEGLGLDELTADWPEQLATFDGLRTPYLLYPPTPPEAP